VATARGSGREDFAELPALSATFRGMSKRGSRVRNRSPVALGLLLEEPAVAQAEVLATRETSG